ncbi:hypothetical protein [uncultured Roseobacter sp.]|uniref:hypothetical protein n=1 Tax=uncultured Roseobacter sp. TaxID=114847 RepID=UPI0026361AFE|nr:hypothetical protein [uncultured Roseobacter sp.]
MKVRHIGSAMVLSIFASGAAAEMVVINGRYIVAKESIRAYFYRERDNRVVFDVRWSDWSTQYRCEDTYDRAEVTAASLNLVLELGQTSALDFEEFLEAEGFTNCAKF